MPCPRLEPLNQKAVIRMSNYLNLVRLLRQHFHDKLQVKTGWGRNEVMAQYDQAATEALAEMLNDQSQCETGSDHTSSREPSE